MLSAFEGVIYLRVLKAFLLDSIWSLRSQMWFWCPVLCLLLTSSSLKDFSIFSLFSTFKFVMCLNAGFYWFILLYFFFLSFCNSSQSYIRSHQLQLLILSFSFYYSISVLCYFLFPYFISFVLSCFLCSDFLNINFLIFVESNHCSSIIYLISKSFFLFSKLFLFLWKIINLFYFVEAKSSVTSHNMFWSLFLSHACTFFL